jgi:hypothetical protein
MWLDLVGQTIMVHYQQAWNIRFYRFILQQVVLRYMHIPSSVARLCRARLQYLLIGLG